MSSRYTHRNLIMWQKAQELAYQVSCYTRRLPQSWTNAVLVRQVVASAYSVGANIAEGHGRYTPGAHRNHLLIARGSAAETDSWLDGLRREGCITADEEVLLVEAYAEIVAMLTSKVRMLDQQLHSRSDRMQEEQELYEVSVPRDGHLFHLRQRTTFEYARFLFSALCSLFCQRRCTHGASRTF